MKAFNAFSCSENSLGTPKTWQALSMQASRFSAILDLYFLTQSHSLHSSLLRNCNVRSDWVKFTRHHSRISNREGLGTSPCIMGLTTQDPYIQKEHTELYKILKFRVNWANIEQDTAIQKLQNLVTNVGIAHTFLCKF